MNSDDSHVEVVKVSLPVKVEFKAKNIKSLLPNWYYLGW